MNSTPLWAKIFAGIIMLPAVLIVGIIAVYLLLSLLTRIQGVTF